MREGSTSLGSLGVIPAGIAMLMLPISLLGLGVLGLGVLGTPKPAHAAQLSARVADQADAIRDALKKRAKWRKPAAPVANGSVVKTIRTHATWYGPGFHGRRTASGERFNRNAMTLASRHLPMGTRVRVINPKTGQAVIARVNDRGPFGHRNITADLSQGLARKIGLRGTGPVKLEVLGRKR